MRKTLIGAVLVSFLGGGATLAGVEKYVRPVIAFEHYELAESFYEYQYEWEEEKLIRLEMYLYELEEEHADPEKILKLKHKIEKQRKKLDVIESKILS